MNTDDNNALTGGFLFFHKNLAHVDHAYSLFITLQMKFVESILSNNTTDDHCREFVNQKGLVPLMGIFGLPNLPVDFPSTQSCQAVASVCKSILVIAIILTEPLDILIQMM